jgi:hypothetical protein
MRTTTSILLLAVLAIAAQGLFAAKGGGGNGGKPGGEEPPACNVDAVFPAMALILGDDLILASSDGCVQVGVMEGRDYGSAELKYDQAHNTGYFAWSELLANGTRVYRQEFTVDQNGGLLTEANDAELLVELNSIRHMFGIMGEGDATRIVIRESGPEPVAGERDRLSSVDIARCNPLPCTDDDMVTIYEPEGPNAQCLPDVGAINGCYYPRDHMILSTDGNTVYFGIGGDNGGNNETVGIAKASYDSDSGTWDAPELVLRDQFFSEARVESLSGDDQLLAVSYSAGFHEDGLRDIRIVFLDTACECDASNPLLPNTVIQDVSSWHASWTVDDTVYLIGNEGKRRKLVHPIEEFDPDPGSGLREPIGIRLDAHYHVDSSL